MNSYFMYTVMKKYVSFNRTLNHIGGLYIPGGPILPGGPIIPGGPIPGGIPGGPIPGGPIPGGIGILIPGGPTIGGIPGPIGPGPIGLIGGPPMLCGGGIALPGCLPNFPLINAAVVASIND